MLLTTLLLFLLKSTAPNIEWTTPMEHDFEVLRRNVAVKTEFKFINKSGAPLIIDAVRTTCGCTAAEYPDAPIMPNETASITIEYDAHKAGFFSKKIKVFFDGQRKPEVLTISGEVE